MPYKQYQNFDKWIDTNKDIKSEDKDKIRNNDKLKYFLSNLINKINDSTFPTTKGLSEEQADNLLQMKPAKLSEKLSNMTIIGLNSQHGGKVIDNLANSLLDFENILDDSIYQYNKLNKYINQIGGNNIDSIKNTISFLDEEAQIYQRSNLQSNKRMSVIIKNIFNNILKNLSDKNIDINEGDINLINDKIEKLEKDEIMLMERIKLLGKYTLLILSGEKKHDNNNTLEKIQKLVDESTDTINSIMKKSNKLKDAMNYTAKLIIQQAINPHSAFISHLERR